MLWSLWSSSSWKFFLSHCLSPILCLLLGCRDGRVTGHLSLFSRGWGHCLLHIFLPACLFLTVAISIISAPQHQPEIFTFCTLESYFLFRSTLKENCHISKCHKFLYIIQLKCPWQLLSQDVKYLLWKKNNFVELGREFGEYLFSNNF